MSRGEVETIAQDCVKDLIMQSYDSDKAHTVFTSNVSAFHSVFGNFFYEWICTGLTCLAR